MNKENKVEKVVQVLENYDYRNMFEKIYPFTTENINGYIDYFDLENKSLLTVGSSSDQVLNAFYCGCKDITLIDLNPFIEEYFNLKKAAIETLDYKDFFKFLGIEGDFFYNFKSLNIKMFKQIIPNIEDEYSSFFWKKVASEYKPHIMRRNLFSFDVPRKYELKKFNNYLKDEESYNKLKRNIKNLKPKFINANIYNYELKKNYDNIFLSNIADYYEVDDTAKLYKRIKNNLNNDGKILVSYLYQTTESTKYEPIYCPIYNLEETLKKIEDVTIHSFEGINDVKYGEFNEKDSILVHKKK